MSSKKRGYESAVREEQADATRRRIVAAATELLVAKGYGGTTVDGVAKAAGVSLQTVYNAVGGKPVLLKAAYDVMLAGDDEPVPVFERPRMLALMAADDPATALGHYAALAREISERVGPLVHVVLAQAAAGDADLQAFAATTDAERLAGAVGVTDHLADRFGLRAGLGKDEAADVVWTLTSYELPRCLVAQRGWSWDHYEAWLADALVHALLEPGGRLPG